MVATQLLTETLFRPLDPHGRAFACRTKGFIYTDGGLLDSIVIYDGDPPEDFRRLHASSDLLAFSRKACPLEAIVARLEWSVLGRRPVGDVRFIAGEPMLDEYFYPVEDDGKLYIFVRTTPWLLRGRGWRYYTFEEITEEPADIRPGDKPADVYFDRIAPRLGHPLVDREFFSKRIHAPTTFEFHSGDDASLMSMLSDLVACLFRRYDCPTFAGHYEIVFSLRRTLVLGVVFAELNEVVFLPKDSSTLDQIKKDFRKHWTCLAADVGRAASRLLRERVAGVSCDGVRLTDGNPIYRKNWEPIWPELTLLRIKVSAEVLSGHAQLHLEQRAACYLD